MQHTPRLLFELEELRSLHGMIIEEEKAITIYVPIEFDRSIVVTLNTAASLNCCRVFVRRQPKGFAVMRIPKPHVKIAAFFILSG